MKKGSGEWGVGSKKLFPYSPFPTPLLHPQSAIQSSSLPLDRELVFDALDAGSLTRDLFGSGLLLRVIDLACDRDLAVLHVDVRADDPVGQILSLDAGQDRRVAGRPFGAALSLFGGYVID